MAIDQKTFIDAVLELKVHSEVARRFGIAPQSVSARVNRYVMNGLLATTAAAKPIPRKSNPSLKLDTNSQLEHRYFASLDDGDYATAQDCFEEMCNRLAAKK